MNFQKDFKLIFIKAIATFKAAVFTGGHVCLQRLHLSMKKLEESRLSIISRMSGAVMLLVLILTTVMILNTGCGSSNDNNDQTKDLPPVYVTFTGHIEDNDYYCNCEVYRSYRKKLLDFAKIIHTGGVKFNLQIEYEFFKGVLNCETEEMLAETAGRNVIDYLVTNYGFEIDAHQEGAWDWVGEDNYADVRYIGRIVTELISETVGGIVWDYALQFPDLVTGQQGKLYPDFTWSPDVITCAVGYNHHQGDFSDDDACSGVWIPAGVNENFRVHDPNGRMVYIGSGPHGNWGNSPDCEFQNVVDYVEVLVDYIQRGVVDPGIFTATIALPQQIMFNEPNKAVELIEQLKPLVESNKVKYVNYTEVVDTWRTHFDSEPNIFPFEEIDPDDYTCP